LSFAQLAAVVFLTALVIAPLVAIGVAAARSAMSPVQWLLWGLAYLLCKFLWRTRWLNQLPIADTRAAIIVCNHRSSIDPFFIQTATRRKTHWMVAREYCEHPLLRWFLSACEVIPVNRAGIDTAGIKAAIRLASSGEIVGMLPEGRINMTDEFLLPARPGAALVALKADVPIVPCYIHGAPFYRFTWSPLLMPARVEVRFGRPIDVAEFRGREDDQAAMQEMTRRALKAIAELAGHSDFEPQFAGRDWKPTEQDLAAAMAASETRGHKKGHRM
jgi:1-acyl-sn-glycerol-3-phosphate acyltransferase